MNFSCDFQLFVCRTLLILSCLSNTRTTPTFQPVDAFSASPAVQYGRSVSYHNYLKIYKNPGIILTSSLNAQRLDRTVVFHNNQKRSGRSFHISPLQDRRNFGGDESSNDDNRSRLGKWITALSVGTFFWARHVGSGRAMAFSLILATTALYRRMQKSNSNSFDYSVDSSSSLSSLPEFVTRSGKNSKPAIAKTVAKSYRTQSWVENRLNHVEAVERLKQERAEEEQAELEAQRIEQARKWASASLESNENALKKAQLGTFNTDEDKRKAQLWVDNAAKTGKIQLGDSTTNGSNKKEYQPWELNSIEEEKRRKQLWVQNAARGSGVQLGGRNPAALARNNNNLDNNTRPPVSEADTVDFNSIDEEKRKQLWIQNAAKGTGIELGQNDEEKRKQEWIQKAAKARGVELGRTHLPRTNDSD
eukprot:CAMPEP_0195287006 /NCGR_PEP_ID=MMETSP0707-20130614/4248_1 /TAXON_ID=33640 /ORGANISM="Asterionellopsis glacialis, Strain CCMP134" /LENGTH=418 /DNA_ID=CAMNT_0040346719 /DNA_START=67 /DNA_END=1323 /DNA_ORIENTATION=+